MQIYGPTFYRSSAQEEIVIVSLFCRCEAAEARPGEKITSQKYFSIEIENEGKRERERAMPLLTDAKNNPPLIIDPEDLIELSWSFG